MQPQFFYFDMGNVLLYFSHEEMAEQMARVAGIQPTLAWKILFEDGLRMGLRARRLTREQFYGRFCERLVRGRHRCSRSGGNDIFDLNAPIIGLVGPLARRRISAGVCSNTSRQSHWGNIARAGFSISPLFRGSRPQFSPSGMKPDRTFYAAAAKLTGVAPAKFSSPTTGPKTSPPPLPPAGTPCSTNRSPS